MKKWEYFSKEELEQFVKNSKTLDEVSMKCGYTHNSGTGRDTIKEMINLYDFDISHFTSKENYNRKNQFDYSRFHNNNYLKSSNSKKAIISLKGYKCECCGNIEWQGKPIPLELHHIDGNHFNNEITNLQLLCPNCHAQTDNYCKKNLYIKDKRNEITEEEIKQALETSETIKQTLIKLELSLKSTANYNKVKKIAEKNNIYLPDNLEKQKIYNGKCKKCGKLISSASFYCKECSNEFVHKRINNKPTREELKKMIKTKSFLEIGREYNVSDNAIRKWCDKENLPRTKKEINSYSDEEWLYI